MPLRELSQKYHPRGDYKECLALSRPASPVVLQKCGSVSKARWMAKIIYTLKMVLCWPKIKHEGILHQDKFVDLLKFVNFVVYIYIEQWFAAPLPTQAPLNDLTFRKKLVHYSTVDRGISDAAVKAFKGHLWYLTENLICLSLFDNRVSF